MSIIINPVDDASVVFDTLAFKQVPRAQTLLLTYFVCDTEGIKLYRFPVIVERSKVTTCLNLARSSTSALTTLLFTEQMNCMT